MHYGRGERATDRLVQERQPAADGGARPRAGPAAGLLLERSAAAASAPPAPGPGVGALAGWKLTLPLPGKKGNAEIVDPAQVAPPWLTADPSGNLTFWAPVNGATTEHSEHARTELDNLSNFQAGGGPRR